MQDKTSIFIAGGMGITPARSILTSLLLRKEKRSIVLIYSVWSREEILFSDTLKNAEENMSLRTRYIIGNEYAKGKVNRNKAIFTAIKELVPNLESAVFYLSGSNSFVMSCQELLLNHTIPVESIKLDIFTGYD